MRATRGTTPTAGSVTRPPRSFIVSLVALLVLVVAVLPESHIQLTPRATFVPAMLALVGCLDILSSVLLVRQFRDTGERSSLALAWAYLFSLAVLCGYGAAFPGVLRDGPGPLGSNPSTSPWLWTAWHTGFPVLLAFAVAGRRRREAQPVPAGRRSRHVWISVPGALIAGAAVVVAAVGLSGSLPTLIHGTDTTRMTHTVGPVVLPLVTLAAIVALIGSLRDPGPQRWVGLAAMAALGDVVLTLFSFHRFSVGWYAGRSLTIASSAVVLIAMLAEFGRLKSRLAEETESLRALLTRTDELEGLQHTLLDHLSEGVMMQDPTGYIVASNPAVRALLEVTRSDLHGQHEIGPTWRILDEYGVPLPVDAIPAAITRATGEPQRERLIGVEFPDQRRRWLRVNTTATPERNGSGRFVISSMSDETERHEERLVRAEAVARRRLRIEDVLAAGGPAVVVQPIVDLRSGRVVGAEALSRFPRHPEPTPDRWFADAEQAGLGLELELAAVRKALALHRGMPEQVYLSVNVSPATACSDALCALLSSAVANRIVLELTEHADVDDYPRLHEALTRLRQRGVRIAVDDTGSGFASLRHILNLLPDVIKLDLALVRGIHADPARRALAQGMLTFATEIGAEIVAEGIETADELEALRDIGIQHGQGYHLGRPGPLPLPDRVAMPRSVSASEAYAPGWH